MALSCTPASLEAAAACFNCYTKKQYDNVNTYLLAQMALNLGAITSADPKVLASAAACFNCLTPELQQVVQSFLLCQLVNK